MARDVRARVFFRGTLVAQTPIHLGSGKDGIDSDAMFARDGNNRIYACGTSLAGPIRRYVTRYLQNTNNSANAERLLGFQCDDDGWASQLIVEDAIVATAAVAEIRDSVAISRDTGVACDQLKFDREVLPKGTEIPLCLEVELVDEDSADDIERALGSLAKALSEDRIRFGSNKTRGLGRVRLNDGHITKKFAPRTKSGMLDLLSFLGHNQGGNAKVQAAAFRLPDEAACSEPRLTFDLHFRCVGPLMVKAAVDGDGADSLPLVSGVENQSVSPVIPGASLKGVFRSTAERILRTLLNPKSISDSDVHGFQNKLSELPLTCLLFGQGGTRNKNNLAGQSAVAIDDCYPGDGFSVLPISVWKRIAAASLDVAANGNGKTPLRTILDQNGLNTWTTGFRIAIDRWTAGPADGMFFKVLEPRGIPWQPIHVAIEFERIPEELQLPAIALFFLTLDELRQGKIPIGHGANRGMGHVILQRVDVCGEALPKDLQSLAAISLNGENLFQVFDTELMNKIRSSWQAYLDEFNASSVHSEHEELQDV